MKTEKPTTTTATNFPKRIWRKLTVNYVLFNDFYRISINVNIPPNGFELSSRGWLCNIAK